MTALTARGWVAFDLHHHSSTVGLVVFASFLPSLIITPFAGVLADRYDRRTMLLTMNAIGLLSTLGLAWFAWTGGQSVWPLVALSFIHGTSRSSSTPVEQAMLSSLVPERDLLNAVSLLQANLNGARLLGPLLAAPLLHVGGGAGAFLVAAALSALALWEIWVLGEVPHQRSGSEHNSLAQFAQGVRYAFHAPVVSSLITLVFLHCAFTMGYDAALPRLASDVLGASGTAYSLLMMAIGGGSLVGAFLLAGFARRVHCGYLLFATSILSGLTLVPLGLRRLLARCAARGGGRRSDTVDVHRAGDDLAPDRHPRSRPRPGAGVVLGVERRGDGLQQPRHRPSGRRVRRRGDARAAGSRLHRGDRPHAVRPAPA